MSDQAAIAFTARLGVLFGEPQTVDPYGTAAEYANAVSGTSHEVLQAAANRLRDSHKVRCWPTVAECLEHIRHVQKMKDLAHRKYRPMVDTEHTLCPRDVSWNDWLQYLMQKGQRDLAQRAVDKGEMVVIGSRWPRPGCKLPIVRD